MPNVVVKVINQATRVNNDVTTNSTGYFRAENLPVGVYDISVNQPGFKTYSMQGIQLDIAARVRHDIALEVGNLTETVTVKASPVEVQTSKRHSVGGDYARADCNRRSEWPALCPPRHADARRGIQLG